MHKTGVIMSGFILLFVRSLLAPSERAEKGARSPIYLPGSNQVSFTLGASRMLV